MAKKAAKKLGVKKAAKKEKEAISGLDLVQDAWFEEIEPALEELAEINGENEDLQAAMLAVHKFLCDPKHAFRMIRQHHGRVWVEEQMKKKP